MIKPKYHVFICNGGKIAGDRKGVCHARRSLEIIEKFISEIDERELSADVMVNAASCFGICAKGPVVAVYPEGVWYGNLTPDDVEAIAEEHLEGGKPVERLLI
ncbi:MAG: (2Fe-2S) ferredoxin domain-containing protein [Clostridiales bacterium]|jgi:(2Fe-2S) ferredoxin|nr:(2Fe-2S) ferredoxin domain-containing protein [Clostridiales bacterium]